MGLTKPFVHWLLGFVTGIVLAAIVLLWLANIAYASGYADGQADASLLAERDAEIHFVRFVDSVTAGFPNLGALRRSDGTEVKLVALCVE